MGGTVRGQGHRLGRLAGAMLLGSVTLAAAQPYFTNGIPLATPPFTGNERLPADTYLAPPTVPQQEGVKFSQFKSYVAGCQIAGSQYQVVTVNVTGDGCVPDSAALLTAGALALGSSGVAGSLVMGNATSGTLVLAPTTGALGTVTASFPANTGLVGELNLAQTWTAVQTVTSADLVVLGSSTGGTALASANVGASNFVATLPANTGTMAELNLAQTWSADQHYGSLDNTGGIVNLAGGSGAMPVYNGVGTLKTGVNLKTVTLAQALTAGAATITLTGSSVFGSTPICVGSDQTAVAAVQVVATSTSSITLAGTGADVIGVVCVGN